MSNKKNLRLLTIPWSDSDENAYRESEAAHGIKIEGKMVWFAKSQIEGWTMSAESVSFYCPMWLIKSNEVEDFIDTSAEPGLFDEM